MTRIMDIMSVRMDRVKKGDKGFTLIELLVVVIIIGILAAIAIPVYIGVQNNAKDSAVKSDLGNAKTAVVANFTAKNGVYADLSALGPDGYPGPSITYTAAGDEPTYVAGKPATNASDFCITAKSPTGKFFYVAASGGVKESTTKPATVAACV